MPRQGRIVLAAASGLLLAAAFPPLDAGILGWVVLIPLLLALEGESPSRALALGWLAGAVGYLLLVSWMRVFGVLAWVLLAAYLSLYVAIFAACYRWIAGSRAPSTGIWTAALLWTGLEYLRSIGVLGFPWALLGLTQWRYPAPLQPARVAGVFGISFLLALAASAAAHAITRRRLLPLIPPVILLAAVLAWSWAQLGPPPAGAVRVAALQPNVPARAKFDPALLADHMNALERLVHQAGQGRADLIVMPETALPYNLFGPSGVLREVGGWANRARATLIASSLENGLANTAVSIAPSGQAMSRYDKVRLVAFGEYGIQPGRRHEPLWTSVGPAGIAICFESIFPDVGRALVRNGAEILAVITNDGWFDGTSGIAQHAAHSVLRAVETGRWVVRAANTGQTILVDPTGRVRGRIDPQVSGVLIGEAGLRRDLTFYARWGDLFAQGALLGLLVIAVPRLRAFLVPDLRTPAFQQAAAAVVLPLAAVWLLLGWAPAGIWPGVLLAFVILLSSLRPPAAWGFRTRGFLATFIAGTAVVTLLWAGLALGFRAYNLPVALPPQAGGWIGMVVRQFAVALAVEGWLRGIAFTPLAEWKGWPAAVAITTALGMFLQRGLPAEAIAWAMITGAAFGAIRARTGNALGLILPHALGTVLFTIVTIVR